MFVVDLLALWQGVPFVMADKSTVTMCCALLCVTCDLPAGEKVCGFLNHTANFGCSKCYCAFSTGIFAVMQGLIALCGYHDLMKGTEGI